MLKKKTQRNLMKYKYYNYKKLGYPFSTVL